jgi:hypothetical protein
MSNHPEALYNCAKGEYKIVHVILLNIGEILILRTHMYVISLYGCTQQEDGLT